MHDTVMSNESSEVRQTKLVNESEETSFSFDLVAGMKESYLPSIAGPGSRPGSGLSAESGSGSLEEGSMSAASGDEQYLLIPRLDLSKLREKDRKRFGISASATTSPEPVSVKIKGDRVRPMSSQSNPDLPDLLRQEMQKSSDSNIGKLKSTMNTDNMIDITRFTSEMVISKGHRKKLAALSPKQTTTEGKKEK